jgi:hypothetical protein
MRMLAKSTLILAIAGLAGFGLCFLLLPDTTLGWAGLELSGVGARTELRTFYGGLELGLAAVLIACLRRPERHRDGLWLTLAVFASLGGARLFGLALDREFSTFLGLALATELGLALLAAAALRFGAPPRPPAAVR